MSSIRSSNRRSRLHWLVAGVSSSDRIRLRMNLTGQTMAGQALWNKAEMKALRVTYPNYSRARKTLIKRTFPAIKSKAWRLGITKPLRIWSDDDLRRLRVLYRSAVPVCEIAQLFGKTKKQVWSRANRSGWHRPRKPPKITHLKLFDDVRSQAFANNLTMRDLASCSRTGSYFLQRPIRSNWKKIGKAVSSLGGEMSIVWKVP
jgi:hypothetical protein